jgi:hypothetical protein
MHEIVLASGHKALVDDADFELVNKHKWHLKKGPYTFYAQCRLKNSDVFLRMHRFILGVINPKVLIDHKDLNGLNNQRDNLRVCTSSQNLQNAPRKSNNTSGFKGVSWNKEKKRWVAKTKFNGKYVFIGRFRKKEDAARAYDKKALELFGEFARTNF